MANVVYVPGCPQKRAYYRAVHEASERDALFDAMRKDPAAPLTAAEVQKLAEKRPGLWSKYAKRAKGG